jgi:hypothetical protein
MPAAPTASVATAVSIIVKDHLGHMDACTAAVSININSI